MEDGQGTHGEAVWDEGLREEGELLDEGSLPMHVVQDESSPAPAVAWAEHELRVVEDGGGSTEMAQNPGWDATADSWSAEAHAGWEGELERPQAKRKRTDQEASDERQIQEDDAQRTEDVRAGTQTASLLSETATIDERVLVAENNIHRERGDTHAQWCAKLGRHHPAFSLPGFWEEPDYVYGVWLKHYELQKKLHPNGEGTTYNY